MCKKIILFLLTLHSLYSSNKDCQNTNYKKVRFFYNLKIIFSNYKNLNGLLEQQIKAFLRNLECLEKFKKEQQKNFCKEKNLSLLLKEQQDGSLVNRSPYLRKINNKLSGSKKIKSMLYEKSDYSLWQKPESSLIIPLSLLKNKAQFLTIFLLWKKDLNAFWKNGIGWYRRDKCWFANLLFSKKYTKQLFKKEKLRKVDKNLCSTMRYIPRSFFYSDSDITFFLKSHNTPLCSTHTSAHAYYVIEKHRNVLSQLSFKNLLELYQAFAKDHLLENVCKKDTIDNNDPFKDAMYNKLTQALTVHIKHMTEKNIPLPEIFLFAKVIRDKISWRRNHNKTTQESQNTEFIKSIKNYIFTYIERKNIFINNIDKEELLKNTFLLITWIEKLIAVLEKNIEPCYRQLSLFAYKAPLTFLESNEYKTITSTNLIVEKINIILKILNNEHFLYFDD